MSMKIRVVSPDRHQDRIVRIYGREPGLGEEVHVHWHKEVDGKLNVHCFDGIVERGIWTMSEDPSNVRCSLHLRKRVRS